MAQEHEMDRRTLLKTTAAGLAVAALPGGDAAAAPLNPIQVENQHPGDTGWQLTYPRIEASTRYRCPWIEGYCSHASIGAGEQLGIQVSTNPPATFVVDIYRMGYYGGAGARHMRRLGPFAGTTQPDPPIGEQRMRECTWKATTTLEIPEDWTSGVYLGKLSLTEGRCESYIVFIVRDERRAGLYFQCSDNTWQAYNRWPDNYAIYDDGDSAWALNDKSRVSYDRPYGKYCQVTDSPLSTGSGEFLLWEFPLAFWLEREGYDVTYGSNTDVHSGASKLERVRGFISVGHDEYWSIEQYNHVKNAVDNGLNAAFLSGNTCCFLAPLSPASDGRPNRNFNRAGAFGGLSALEAKRMGPFGIEGPDEALLIGAKSIIPFNGSGDWIVRKPEHWLFEGTGMHRGEGIPGLVGWEFHGEPAAIPGLEIIAEGETINAGDEPAHWTATIYPGPKGNVVFNASTIFWAQGLSQPPGHTYPYAHFGRPHGPDARVQRITHNLFRRFLA